MDRFAAALVALDQVLRFPSKAFPTASPTRDFQVTSSASESSVMPLLYPCGHQAHLPAWKAAMVPAPIVVTLAVDEATQAGWDRMRRQWFPPERRVVGAHVTLFHALPGGRLDALLLDVAEVAATTGPFPVAVTAVRSLGRGVALQVRSAILDRLHADLADRWRPWLTPQDAARFSAHVTIQNKVSPEVARSTLAEVAGSFTPYEALATGLATWRYVGGPWEPVLVTPFPSSSPSPVLRATPGVPEPGLSGDQSKPRSPASAGPPRPSPSGIAEVEGVSDEQHDGGLG